MTSGEYRSPSETPLSVVFDCLVSTLRGELYPETLENIKQDVLETVESTSLKGVIFDMCAVRALDSFSFEYLVKTVKMIKLLGVEAVFVGLQPGVVSAIVELDVDFDGFQTFLTMEDAFNHLGVHQRIIETPYDDEDLETDEEYYEEYYEEVLENDEYGAVGQWTE